MKESNTSLVSAVLFAMVLILGLLNQDYADVKTLDIVQHGLWAIVFISCLYYYFKKKKEEKANG